MKKVKLFCTFLTSFVLLFSVSLAKIPQPTSDFYVNDFANVLSGETEQYIMRHSVELQRQTKAQIVVSTVPSLEGKDIDRYALEMGRNYAIGDEDLDNGILILLAPNEREVKIEVGYGLEGAVNDAKAGRILDNAGVPYFSKNDWNSGIIEVYKSLLYETYNEYNLEIPSDVAPIYYDESYDSGSFESMTAIIILIIILIIFFSGRFGGGCCWFPFGGFFGGGRYYGGGFGGGYRGGGFGGGGGFSGGGGSFGGGGAGRKF